LYCEDPENRGNQKTGHPFEEAQVTFYAAYAFARIPETLAHLQPQLGKLTLVVGDLLSRGSCLVVRHVARTQSLVELTEHQGHGYLFGHQPGQIATRSTISPRLSL
jgi:hypothetical protein